MTQLKKLFLKKGKIIIFQLNIENYELIQLYCQKEYTFIKYDQMLNSFHNP